MARIRDELSDMHFQPATVNRHSWLLAAAWTAILAVSFWSGKVWQEEHTLQLWAHLGIWLLGMGGVVAGTRLLIRGLRHQERLAADWQHAVASIEATIENVPVGIVIVGTDKIVRRVNRMALEILGKPRDEVVGRLCHENICPAEEGHCPVLDNLQQLDNSSREALGKAGRRVPILKTVIPFRLDGEEVLLEAFVDTTEQVQKNEELLATVGELQRFNRLAVGREIRMAELKQEVNALLAELEREPRYRAGDAVATGGDR
jgi:PAS domain S-box-containing protein